MKKMKIFEPAMCCPTGICGVGVDPELLRISAALDTLKNTMFPLTDSTSTARRWSLLRTKPSTPISTRRA